VGTEIVEGGRRPALRTAAAEAWSYRSVVVAFAERDVRVKYKQAVLGIAWAVIQPLAFMTVFTFTIGRILDTGAGGVPYAAFSLAAFVGWTLLQAGVNQGANALIADGPLLRKVYFPREVPVLGGVLAASVDFVVGLGLFVVVGPFLGARISPTWLLAPLIGVLILTLGVGVSLLLAGLNVYYRDFRHALPFMLQLWLFASPVAYPITVIPDRLRIPYATVNPAAGLLDAFQRSLAAGQLPDPALLGASAAGTLIVFLVGYRLFKTLEPNFADVV
jgi:ABC-type polysaccharide/polyol phosphate export permease